MKNTLLAALSFILLSTPLAATAQFTYTLFHAQATITGYTGPGGEVTIPATINGYPVVAVGNSAFQNKSSLTSVSIPNGVTVIGTNAFFNCIGLTSVTIPGSVTRIESSAFTYCTSLTSITIPNSVNRIGDSVFAHCTNLTKVTIPNSVTVIGRYAFYDCASLTSITIPNSLTAIGEHAFHSSTSLTGVFFKGNAPSFGADVFFGDNNATVYYLPGTTGWGPTFGDRPAVLWNPLMQTGDASFGVRTNRFGFTITGTTNIPIVIEASTSLANGSWVALQSLNLTNGAFYFSDPDWTNYPARTYRIRSP